MLKRCIQLFGLARNPGSGSKPNKQLTGPSVDDRPEIKEVDVASISLDLSWRSKDIFVRIVHAGGREELYQNVVPASQLMEKYPGMCVAHPEAFKNPQAALLRPEESLLVGQKYYMIPYTTAQKIKKKHKKKLMAKETAEGKEEVPTQMILFAPLKNIMAPRKDGQNVYREKVSEERSLLFPHSRGQDHVEE